MSRTRKAAYAHGRRAEAIALWYLRLKGYRLVARRYRSPAGEIDLIMRNRDTLVFVEVKARRSVDNGLLAVTPDQSRRIARAAGHFAARHPEHLKAFQRFDIVAVPSYLWPSHIKNAFEAS